MSYRKYIPYGVAFLLLFVGAFYDYQLTDLLYHKASLFGLFFERILLIPIQSVVMFTMCMLYCQRKQKIFLACSVIANGYVLYHSLSYWIHIETVFIFVILMLVSLGITCLTVWLLRRMDPHWISQHLSFFLFFTAVLLSAALVTTMMKIGWGRIRYRDLQSASQFCVWYQPCGLIGNRSFPSGHTTAMSTILCVLQWKQNRYQKPSLLCYGVVVIGIVLMAISRMIMGAHFLSDTAAGFLVTYTCYLLIYAWFQRRGYL